MKKTASLILLILFSFMVFSQTTLQEKTHQIINNQIEESKEIYIDLHQSPELSLMEFKPAEKMAKKLKNLGFDVTSNVGGNGVVGIFKNGTTLPGLHNSAFYPDFEPTFRTGVSAMPLTMIQLFNEK